MFDEKELEELYDDFLGLDGDVFLESEVHVGKLDNDTLTRDIDANPTKPPLNLKNNNFWGGTGIARVDRPDVSIQLDLLNQNFISLDISDYERKSKSPSGILDLRAAGGTSARPTLSLDKKGDEVDNELKEVDEKLICPSPSVEHNSFHRVGWTPDSLGLWHSGPSSLNLPQPPPKNAPYQDLSTSVTCPSHGSQAFGSFSSSAKRTYSHQQLGVKVEMVYSLLSMLDTDNREDMSKTFLAMSSSPESCHAMRQSGCLPLLIQLIHSSELDREVRNRAAEALHNVVHSQTDEKRRKREVRVLKLLQQVREYCDELRNDSSPSPSQAEPDRHPINATGTLMKLSFDAEHRLAICTLGGLHAITDLIQVDHRFHGSTNNDALCITLRRYAGMSLTNLTFGDGKNKALLCSFTKFLLALTDQLKSPSEELRQVTASVLRNLSWRADAESKQALRNVGAVTALTTSAMEARKESTLKSILSALWNLSAHCSLNKIDICSVPGALAFLVKMLKYKSTSNTLSIIENAGGILRNVSSHIAVREDYRQVLRDNCCFEVLLEQLRSPSLTIVSNACGTLWNLSARCPEDQKRLWEMGATTMLRSLVQSKHKMISMGSSAALKNLLAANPDENLLTHLDSTAKSLGLQNLPTLFVRKKRALEQELNITLAETCENIEPSVSSSHSDKSEGGLAGKDADGPKRSESRDSVKSTQSDTIYERISQIAHVSEDKVLGNSYATLHDSLDEKLTNRRAEDQRLMKRYTVSMIPTPTSKKINQDRINEKTREKSPFEDNSHEVVTEAHVKEHARADSKQKNKKGIPIRKTKPNRTVLQDAVESRSPSKLRENSSQELEKTKSLEVVDSVDSLLDSRITTVDAHSSHGKSAGKEPDNDDKCGGDGEHEEEQDGVTYSREPVPSTDFSSRLRSGQELSKMSSRVNTGPACRKTNPKEADDNLNSNVNGMKITERGSGDMGCLSGNSPRIVYCTPRDHDSATGKLTSDDGPSSIDHYEENPRDGSLEVDAESTDGVPQVSKQSVSNGSQPSQKTKFSEPSSEKYLKENLQELSEEGKTQSGSELDAEDVDLTANSLRELGPGRSGPIPIEQRPGCGTDEDYLFIPEKSPKRCIASPTFDDCNGERKRCPDVGPNPHSHASRAAGNLTNQSDKANGLFASDGTEGSFRSLPVSLKTSSACTLPRFKVGSPITDPGVLQMEARKVCGEIQKHQDFEMGCSLNSEVSLVSCSSFLDSGDYSLFESSADPITFDESELAKVVPKMKNDPFQKSLFQSAEPISLPSLGSLRNEQIEVLDLDNSVLSVASITSEIDENYAKDQGGFSSYTNTYKIDARSEFPEEISADATLVSKADDDTLDAELDDDNSLHSQENLPLDTSDTCQEGSSDRLRLKLTPKEKRKNFQERYRTYTIRDFKDCKSTGMAAFTTDQGKSDVELAPDSGAFHSDAGGPCSQFDVPRDIEHDEENVNAKAHAHDSPSWTSYSGRGREPLQFSKSFDKEREHFPEFAVDSRSLNDLLSVGPSERKELVDNAKLVAFSLKTAVHDWEPDLVSDSESEEHVKSSAIDTATYTKSFRSGSQTRPSFQELQGLQSSSGSCVENSKKIGVRVCKPAEKAEDEALEELSRGVRGRRKPLYSSPKKNPLKIKGISSASSTARVTATTADARKPSPQPTCRSPVLHREGTFTKEDASVLKKPEGKNAGTKQSRSSDMKNSKNVIAKSRLVPSGGNSKGVGESRVSRMGRPLSTCAFKTNGIDKQTEPDSSQRRPFSAETGSRAVCDGTAAGKKPASACPAPQRIRNSSSSHNVKSGSSSGSGSPKPRVADSQSGKSQSDASLNLVDSKDKVGVGKLRSKKEVASRIAGLWRKVEESKKNKTSKDTRVWIQPQKYTPPSDTLVMEEEQIVHIPTRTIVHSFTCQALDTYNDSASHQRNSRNSDVSYCGSKEEEHDRNQKRNIISAVVTPYNYNPPLSMTSPASFTEIENFQKSSLKVTTV